MLLEAVWIFFDYLGVPGMHTPLYRQWASTWAQTVRFLGICFSTYYTPPIKSTFICAQVFGANVDREASFPALQWAAPGTCSHAHFPVRVAALLRLPEPWLALSRSLVGRGCLQEHILAGAGLTGPISLAAAKPGQKIPQLWCPGLDSSWAGPSPGAFLAYGQKKVQIQLKGVRPTA